MIRRMIDKIINLDKNYYYIIFISLFIVFPLISRNFVLGHDSLYHIANIDAITKSWESLNFTKISSVIANNFGYGGAIFYPKLPHYFTALINLVISNLGYSTIYSLKISYVIVIILAGIFMYMLLNFLFNNKKISLLGSAIYITMPYFINEMFVRGAFNEFFMYIFMPIIFIGLIKLSQNKIKEFYFYFIIGYLGIINSHLVLSVYFTFLVLIYMLINFKSFFNKISLKHLVIASIIILVLISPNIILMLQHKFLNIYGVFTQDVINATSSAVKKFGITLYNYFIPSIKDYDNTYYFINFIVLILAILGFYYMFFKERSKDRKIILIGLFVFLLLAFFLSLQIFPYEYFPDILLSIQFAFRNETFVCFAISIFAAYGLFLFKDKTRNIIIFGTIVCSCCLGALFINEASFSSVSSLDSWDKYAGMGAQKEYLTLNALDNLDYFDNRDNEVIVLSDSDVEIEIISDDVPYLEFEVSNLSGDSVYLELPRLYYLGYDITLTTEDEVISIDYENSDNGFIEINLNSNGVVKVEYVGTLIYRVAKIIRNLFIFALIIFLGYSGYNKIASKR